MLKWRWRFRSRKDDWDRELQAHLAAEAEEWKASGFSAEEAEYRARRALGNVTLIKENLHGLTWMRWAESLRQDLQFAVRLFRKNPGFSVTALVMLGLGMGAASTVFSVVQAILLRPLPYQQADRLVVIWDRASNAKSESKLFASYSDFLAYQAHSRTLQEVSGLTWAVAGQTLSGRGPSKDVLAVPVTESFFHLIGVQAERGRVFQREDLNRGCAVVLSHSFWTRALDGDRNIVGQTLRLDDRACSVVGVMPASFTFYPEQAELWTLLTPNSPLLAKPDDLSIGIFARVRRGTSLPAAQEELAALHRRAHVHDRHGHETQARIYSLKEEFTWLASRTLRLSLLILFVAVAFVLLIACMNTANLLLGRSVTRQREMGIRAAIGSGRMRLIRQLLTESLLLSLGAAAMGTGLAWAAVRWFRSVAPIQMPPGTRIEIDGVVLLFSAILSIFTVVVFGLLPAWRISDVNLTEVLKTGGRGTTQKSVKRLSKALVVFELMLSLVLLVGAGLLIETLIKFASPPLGYAMDHMLTVKVGLPVQTYSSDKKRVQFAERLLTGVQTIPGVKSVAVASAEPLRGIQKTDVLEVAGRPVPSPDEARQDLGSESVSAGFFSINGLAVMRGRPFDGRDRSDSVATAIVNEALARSYFPDKNPIGEQIRFLGTSGTSGAWLTIVGVVANEKRSTVYKEMTWVEMPIVYRPWLQDPKGFTLLMSTTLNGAGSIGNLVSREAGEIDPFVTVDNARTVAELLRNEYLSYPRFRAMLLGSFAVISMLLALVGLYGVLAQLVAQRTQEIGVRMALGAQPRDVLSGHIKEGAWLAGTGIVGGIGLSWLLLRFMSSLLYGVPALDPVMLAIISAALMITALAATYIPARRASYVDPIRALRYE